MSNMAQPNYSEALKEIKLSIRVLSNEIVEIKALLSKVVGEKENEELQQQVYPWHFPNVSTSADHHEEEQ
jgi:inhibitor of KinA sporulation pathway (predicted exonuclease)